MAEMDGHRLKAVLMCVAWFARERPARAGRWFRRYRKKVRAYGTNAGGTAEGLPFVPMFWEERLFCLSLEGIMYEKEFWAALDKLVESSAIIIDRPKGSAHPRYTEYIYPLDYGYLDGTSSMDGEGIDLWRGSKADQTLDALLCTVDLVKRDSEIKLLLGCTEDEIQTVLAFHNQHELMRGMLVRRT